MADAFNIISPIVKAEGKDVPPEQIQGAFLNLTHQINLALNSISLGSGPVFSAAMLAWFNSLPTTLPATSGVLWNDGGTLALS